MSADEETVLRSWSNPDGATLKQTDDVRIVEITYRVRTRGPVNSDGIPYSHPSKTEEEILDMVEGWLGVRRSERWPKALLEVQIDAIYLEDEDV